MPEKTHAEMEREHYEALTNPPYRMEGRMDILYEEMMMAQPLPKESQIVPVYQDTRWTNRQWDSVGQLTGLVRHLENKLNSYLDKSSKKKGNKYVIS